MQNLLALILNRMILVALICPLAHADKQSSAESSTPSQTDSSQDTIPSPEFLEFLAEFEDLDDETFEMLLENGIADAIKQQESQTNVSKNSASVNSSEEDTHE